MGLFCIFVIKRVHYQPGQK
ncbi:erythromycin resistance leader peptide [Amphibacillus sediminis]